MTDSVYRGPLEQVDACRWRIPSSYKHGMRVDGMIYASEPMIARIIADQAAEQVANVACLPGIQTASLAMPDIHWGYGFCIGGVCATDPAEGGVVSPGGVGYDINCGVRLVRTHLTQDDVRPRLRELIDALFAKIPTGVGRSGQYHFDTRELRKLMTQGPRVLLRRGLATERDIEFTEEHGCLDGADPDCVSVRAMQRGEEQCGTLGSGNHFLEIQVVEQIVDPAAAAAMDLRQGQICVMIHSGSRGLGYQVCDDALRNLRGVPERYGFHLPDRQLACAPVHSSEGQHYLSAMRGAANYAWCNRQLLMWQMREVFQKVLGKGWPHLGIELIYDVAHNIAKIEDHTIAGQLKQVLVHRKGATRAFPPGHPDIPAAYREIGQPVIIPGDMGRASWVLVGQETSMEATFGTTCHGAGRAMSRTAALKDAGNRRIDEELAARGIIVRAPNRKGLAEEQSAAYKDVDMVVDVVEQAGLSRKVARLLPMGVIKG